MDAVKYLKERKRMCEAAGWGCRSCYLVKKTDKTCWTLEEEDIDEAIKAVGNWSKEHKVKTRQTEFLKVITNATVNEKTGILNIMPCIVDESVVIPNNKYGGCKRYESDGYCGNCMRDYWSEEVK